jgi:hypothetical protein
MFPANMNFQQVRRNTNCFGEQYWKRTFPTVVSLNSLCKGIDSIAEYEKHNSKRIQPLKTVDSSIYITQNRLSKVNDQLRVQRSSTQSRKPVYIGRHRSSLSFGSKSRLWHLPTECSSFVGRGAGNVARAAEDSLLYTDGGRRYHFAAFGWRRGRFLAVAATVPPDGSPTKESECRRTLFFCPLPARGDFPRDDHGDA